MKSINRAAEKNMPVFFVSRIKSIRHRFLHRKFTTREREQNYLIAQEDYLRRNTVVRSLPHFAFIDPTNICNLKCQFCPTNKGELTYNNEKFPRSMERPRGFLAMETFNLVLEAFGKTLYGINFFNWGEPLLHEKVFEMVSLAGKWNIETTISSNMNIRDHALAEKICESGLDNLIMSIDGISESTYSFYRRGGDFNLVLSNMDAIVSYKKRYRLKKPSLVWQFLVFRHNEHELKDLRKVARSHNIDSIDIACANIYDKGWIPQSPKYIRHSPLFEKSCHWLWSTATVTPDGSLSPCCMNRSSVFDIGSFRNATDLRKLWNSDKIIAARNYYHDHTANSVIPCDRCPLLDHKYFYGRYELPDHKS